MVRWIRQGGLIQGLVRVVRLIVRWILVWLSHLVGKGVRATRIWLRVLVWTVRPRDPNNLFVSTDGAYYAEERGRVAHDLAAGESTGESTPTLLYAGEPSPEEAPVQADAVGLLRVRKITAESIGDRTAMVNRRFSYTDVLSHEIKRLRDPEISQLGEIVQRLARKWLDVDEQFNQVPRRNHLDVWGTLRYNIPRYGGHILNFRWATKERPLPQMAKPARILLVGDVSHSMVHYVSVVLYFFHMLNFRFQVESYVFSQKPTHASPFLNGLGTFQEKVQLLTQNARSWNAGTRFGSSLEEIMAEAAAFIDEYTYVIIATDGKVSLHGGEYEKIDQQMHRLRGMARQVIFLTPSADFSDGAGGNVKAEVLGSFKYDFHEIPIFGMGPPLWYGTLGQYADRLYLVRSVQDLIDMCEDLIMASRS